MGNFEEHLQYGIAALLLTLLLTIGAAYTFLWPVEFLIAVLPLIFSITLLGAIIPDIDHHNSHPYKMLQKIVPITVGIISLGTFWIYHQSITIFIQTQVYQIEPFYIGVLEFLMAFVLTGTTRKIIAELRPPHRGITHSLPFILTAGVITSGISVITLEPLPLQYELLYSVSILLGVSMCVGIGSHLYCDDMLRSSLTKYYN